MSPISLALITLLAPFCAFLLVALITPLRNSGRLAAYASILGIAASTLASSTLLLKLLKLPLSYESNILWIPFSSLPQVTIGILVDPLSSLMLFLVALVACMVQVYSLGYMREERSPSLGRYYTYHSLFATSMLGLVLANNLLFTYIFWELVGLCSYLLIGFWYTKPEAARAAMKAFWTTKLGDVGFIIGIIFIYTRYGTLNLSELFALVKTSDFPTFLAMLIFIGAMGKSAQFPLHVWLPDAMEGPTPVSALIHAATMVAAGVYLVARSFPLFEAAPGALTTVAYIGSFTAFFAATMALVEPDIKRVLAYSTISQLGYMMTGLGVGSLSAGFFHLTTHAFFKALLFLAAGSVIHAVKTNNIFAMGRLRKDLPQTAVLFIIGALALTGIYPFSGYFSKEEILKIAYTRGAYLPFIFTGLTVFLTAFYMFRVIFTVFFGKTVPGGHPHESPKVMRNPMWLLAIFSVVSGFPHKTITHFLEGEKLHEIEVGFITPLALLLGILGIFLAYLIYHKAILNHEKIREQTKPLYKTLQRRYFLDDVYEFIYRRIVLLFSLIFGWFDRYLVDGVVNFVSFLTSRGGSYLRKLQNGQVQDYLYGILWGFLILAMWGYFLIS